MWKTGVLLFSLVHLALGQAAQAAPPIRWDTVTFGVEFTAVDPNQREFLVSPHQVPQAVDRFLALTHGKELSRSCSPEHCTIVVQTELGKWEFHLDDWALEVSGPPLTLKQYQETSEITALFEAFEAAALAPEVGLGGAYGGGGHIHIDARVFRGRPFLLRNFVTFMRMPEVYSIFKEYFDDQSVSPTFWGYWTDWNLPADHPPLSVFEGRAIFDLSMAELDRRLRAFAEGQGPLPSDHFVVSALSGAYLSPDWDDQRKTEQSVVHLSARIDAKGKYLKPFIGNQSQVLQHLPNAPSDFRMAGILNGRRPRHPTLEARAFSAPRSYLHILRRIEWIGAVLRYLESLETALIDRMSLQRYLARPQFPTHDSLALFWLNWLPKIGFDDKRIWGFFRDIYAHLPPLLSNDVFEIFFVDSGGATYIDLKLKGEMTKNLPLGWMPEVLARASYRGNIVPASVVGASGQHFLIELPRQVFHPPQKDPAARENLYDASGGPFLKIVFPPQNALAQASTYVVRLGNFADPLRSSFAIPAADCVDLLK